jgi:alkanesulfonate monooxygenase SsuD/methylene tetrahydromethanopterin reductase-like flavin-dependent oxidoreductase (luciferase family)
MAPEFHLFLPQMRMGLDAIVERARAAEAGRFGGMALIDHLSPPGVPGQPMYDAIITATWLAARTEHLKLGHLVLCDAFRHPAILAQQGVAIDHASGGRFELGIGWGSVPAELETFGVGDTVAAARVRRLAETLDVVKALWAGETVDYHGEFHHIRGGSQRPLPLTRIPILIGGAGARTMPLVAAHADWWNLPIYALDRLEALKQHSGKARTSLQLMVAYVHTEAERAEVGALATRRFATMGAGPLVASAGELIDHFSSLYERGVERFYVWFADFANPETLAAFGDDVIGAMGAG